MHAIPIHEPLATRTDWRATAPRPLAAMARLDAAIDLDPRLRALVRLRASQVNGCAFSIDRYAQDARRAGEGEQRLHALVAWRATTFFSDRERAALALTEVVTLVAETDVTDAVWELAAEHFGATELAELVFAIVAVNAWNRLAITARAVPGSYEPAAA